MTWLRVAIARVIELGRRRRLATDLDAELQSHLDHAIADGIRRGWSPAEARRHALAALGGLEPVREAVADRRGIRSLETFASALRFAVRQLRKNPGVTLACITTLALSIGANTAIFSLVDTALLRPLPYADPGRLVSVWETTPGDGAPRRLAVSPADYQDYRRAPTAAAMGAYIATSMTLTGRGDPARLTGELVTASYFDVFGVAPQRGRPLQVADEITGRDRVVVISQALWRERFGGRDDAVGARVMLNDESYEVVGVMPAEFLGAASYRQQVASDFWAPATFPPEIATNRSEHILHVVARLAPERTPAGLEVDLNRIAAGFEKTGAAAIGVGVAEFQADVARDVRPLLLFLLAAVGLILLLACVNVAGLLIVQSMSRRREIAVRFALGATRTRVAIELLIPSLLMAAIGAGAGWLLALLLKDALVHLAPTTIPRLGTVALDARVLAFTSMAAGGAAVVFSILPAWPLVRTRPIDALAATSRIVAHSWALRSRRLLVALEVGISVLLLVGAALMIRTLSALNGTELGFRTDNVLTTSVALPPARYATPEARLRFFENLSARMAAVPGVRAVTFANRLPLRSAWTSGLLIEGAPPPAPGAPGLTAGFQSVSPGYFATLGVPLLRGRLIEDGDREGATPVAVVNQAFVTTLLGGGDPIGRQLRRFAKAPAVTIVGVVADIRRHGPRFPVDAEVYLPARQTSLYPLPLSEFAIRVESDPAAFAGVVRSAILAIDDRQPPGITRTLDETRARVHAAPRFQVFLLTMFAALALALAVIGIYGVVAYAVAQRTPEIGLRVALGANRGSVLRWLLLQTLRPAIAGAATGLVAAVVLARALRGFLFEISPADPAAYAAAAGILALAATIAGLLAARRALSVDPITVLR